LTATQQLGKEVNITILQCAQK